MSSAERRVENHRVDRTGHVRIRPRFARWHRHQPERAERRQGEQRRQQQQCLHGHSGGMPQAEQRGEARRAQNNRSTHPLAVSISADLRSWGGFDDS